MPERGWRAGSRGSMYGMAFSAPGVFGKMNSTTSRTIVFSSFESKGIS